MGAQGFPPSPSLALGPSPSSPLPVGSKDGDHRARGGVGKSIKQEGEWIRVQKDSLKKEEETLKDERLQTNFNSGPTETPFHD